MIPRLTPCLFVLILTHVAVAQTVQIDPKLAGLREAWQSAIAEMDIPGAAVVVVKDGKVILLEPMGVRDVASNEPVTPDTIFYIASCTKSFNAMAALTLVEEGKLELDAPVKKYLPQFQVADAELTEKLTIRDLLCHAKGLDSGNITFGEAYSGEMNDARYWRMMKTARATGGFRYTNLHYTILGRVIEEVTGQHWKDFVETRVCKPAGMNRTTAYASRMYGDANVATPTIYWDKKLIAAPQRKTDRTMHAAGGMGSTASDLARWMRLNLGGGAIDGKRILSEKLTRQMQQRHATMEPRGTPVPELFHDGYGLGWQTGSYKGKRFIQHGGGYVGTAALITLFPEENLGVAVLVNTDGGGGAFIAMATVNVLDRMFGFDPPVDMLPTIRPRHEQFRQRRAEQAAASTQPVDANALSLPIAAYAGAYHNDDLGTVTIAPKDGRLTFTLGDLRPHLFAADEKDTFRAAFSGGVIDGGRFEIEEDKVKALITRSGDDEERFERK
jgi:CubicO group peptidase (beta-lactamase class C family)